MEKQYEKKITWTIKDFTSLQSDEIISSDHFLVGDSKWKWFLLAGVLGSIPREKEMVLINICLCFWLLLILNLCLAVLICGLSRESLYQPPEKLSTLDLSKAYSTLSYVTKAGFKLDWLENKMKEVGETRLQEIEDELKNIKQECADIVALKKNLKQNCSDMEALLELLR